MGHTRYPDPENLGGHKVLTNALIGYSGCLAIRRQMKHLWNDVRQPMIKKSAVQSNNRLRISLLCNLHKRHISFVRINPTIHAKQAVL